MKWMLRTALLTAAVTALAVAGCSQKPSQQELNEQLAQAQRAQDPEAALEVYRSIVQHYPEGEQAPKAQFMVGYLYANEMGDTSRAREAYDTFLTRYAAESDTALVLSAKVELEMLGQGQDALAKKLFGEDAVAPETQKKTKTPPPPPERDRKKDETR